MFFGRCGAFGGWRHKVFLAFLRRNRFSQSVSLLTPGIESGIGHLKGEHRMNRCRLKGIEGDQANAILSSTGMNFRKLMKDVARLPACLRPVFAHLFEALEQALRPLRLKHLFFDQPDRNRVFF